VLVQEDAAPLVGGVSMERRQVGGTIMKAIGDGENVVELTLTKLLLSDAALQFMQVRREVSLKTHMQLSDTLATLIPYR
jgi:hypothetical protein